MGKLILFRDREFHIVETEDDVSLEQMYKLVDCDTLDVVSLEDNIDIWVDDNGLLKSGNIVHTVKVGEQGEMQLAGNLLFLSHNEEGETLALNEKQVDWLHRNITLIPYGVTR